jgi:hypothetical protein
VTTERDKAVPGGVAQYARRVDSGSSVWYLGNLFTILAGSEDTEGRFALIEMLARKGTEPPRHVHHREDEAFYVLEGEITFYIGDETYVATPARSSSRRAASLTRGCSRLTWSASSSPSRRGVPMSTSGTPGSASPPGR